MNDLDAGYKSGSCSDESSVDIEIEDTEPATRRSSSVVQDVEVTDVTPAPTRSAGAAGTAGAAGAAGAAAAKARQPTIARFFTSKEALTPQQQRAKEKRAEQRQRDVAAALANPTAPTRATHINKVRVVRSHAKVRAARHRAAEKEEERGK